MHCFYDYIGIKGYGSTEPLSGLYINQLPGITLESIDKSAEKEQINFAGVWKDVQTRAWMRFEKDFRRALRNRFRLSALKATASIKPLINEDEIIVAAEKYRGIVIDLNNVLYQSFFDDPSHDNEFFFDQTFDRSKGSFLSLYVDKIGITLKENTGSLVLKIFDVSGQVLDSFTKANALAGYNEFVVTKKYFTHRIFVAVDASAIDLFEATLPKEDAYNCYQSLVAIFPDCQPQVLGAEADKATPGKLTKNVNTFLNVTYSAVCDYSAIICNNRPEFTDVWMYLLANELMLERLYTSRMNRYTTIDKESAGELKDYFSVEYEKALKETIDALEISREDCCIECNPLITTREALP